MFDSALRLELTTKDAILQECDSLRRDAGRVLRALHYDYADARSENGGEFECRAVIIEAGFMVPELQVEFNIDGRIKLLTLCIRWRQCPLPAADIPLVV